jgi:hypothetical protein
LCIFFCLIVLVSQGTWMLLPSTWWELRQRTGTHMLFFTRLWYESGDKMIFKCTVRVRVRTLKLSKWEHWVVSTTVTIRGLIFRSYMVMVCQCDDVAVLADLEKESYIPIIMCIFSFIKFLKCVSCIFRFINWVETHICWGEVTKFHSIITQFLSLSKLVRYIFTPSSK